MRLVLGFSFYSTDLKIDKSRFLIVQFYVKDLKNALKISFRGVSLEYCH